MSRRLSATLLGGLGAAFLIVAVIAFSIFSFVSSATATRQSVESLAGDAAIRQSIANEVVTAIEESGDSPQEKVVFSLARPLIENAVSRAIESSRLQTFFGEVSYKAYEVFVEEQPSSTVDVTPIIDVAVDAIKQIDPRIAKNFAPKIDPLTLERDADTPNLKGIRNGVRTATWALLIIGLLLQIASWFLASADNVTKMRRLGIRVVVIGVLVVLAAVVARQVAPNFSKDNHDLIAALTQFVTEPVLVRGIVIAIAGVATTGAGWVISRRTSHLPEDLDRATSN